MAFEIILSGGPFLFQFPFPIPRGNQMIIIFSYENDVDCSVTYRTSCAKLSFACKYFDIDNKKATCNAKDDHLVVNNKRYI